MADALAHRGPDGAGFALAGRGDRGPRLQHRPEALAQAPLAALVHRRLSIIDVSHASDQPMIDEELGLALSYNGELYNYLEVRAELERRGHAFRTTGDTEVVLRAYAEWGPDCCERLVGMWALAILDLPRGELFLSRDRFGIKPLFWELDESGFAFASEIKGLLAGRSSSPPPDPGVVARYLLTGIVDDGERTFFAGIRRLPAAHNALIQLDRPSRPMLRRYWELDARQYTGSQPDAANEFRQRLTDSVRIHLRSDVPVGTCLSGGLDSSSIVCVADGLKQSGGVSSYAHHGFGYVPPDPEFSERVHMATVANHASVAMTYVEPTAEDFEVLLPRLVRQQDEPFGSTSIAAQWFVFARAAGSGLKVMLDGQGADEVLGGYHGYLDTIASSLIRTGRYVAYARYARAYRRELGRSPSAHRKPFADLATGIRLILPTRGRAAAEPGPTGAASLIAPGLHDSYDAADVEVPVPGSLDEILRLHTLSLNLPALLRYEDRNSMAHSIEARVPFLDHRLVEFAFSLPEDLKIQDATTKHVLREAMRGVLPEEIRTRSDKIGFRADPAVAWRLASKSRESLLQPRTDWEARWLDAAGLARLIDSSDRSPQAEFLLWRALNLILWLRAFWADDVAESANLDSENQARRATA